GEVRSGAPLAHRFTFVNNGPETVEITDIHSSCGCLLPRLDKRVYQPGERGSFLMEVNTLSQGAGPHTWQAKLAYQASSNIHEIPLRLTGMIVTELTVQPVALTMLADSNIGHDVLVTDLRARALMISRVQTSSPGLEARVGESSLDLQGHHVQKIR